MWCLELLNFFWVFVHHHHCSFVTAAVVLFCSGWPLVFTLAGGHVALQSFANASALLCASDNSTVSAATCDSMLDASKFVANNSRRFAIVYHLFGLLWTNQFIQVWPCFVGCFVLPLFSPPVYCVVVVLFMTDAFLAFFCVVDVGVGIVLHMLQVAPLLHAVRLNSSCVRAVFRRHGGRWRGVPVVLHR